MNQLADKLDMALLPEDARVAMKRRTRHKSKSKKSKQKDKTNAEERVCEFFSCISLYLGLLSYILQYCQKWTYQNSKYIWKAREEKKEERRRRRRRAREEEETQKKQEKAVKREHVAYDDGEYEDEDEIDLDDIVDDEVGSAFAQWKADETAQRSNSNGDEKHQPENRQQKAETDTERKVREHEREARARDRMEAERQANMIEEISEEEIEEEGDDDDWMNNDDDDDDDDEIELWQTPAKALERTSMNK